MKKEILILGICIVLLFVGLSGCIDTGKLAITVNKYGRNEDGSFYVIATVSNTLDKEVNGAFGLQVFDLSSHKEYGGYFRDELFDMQFNSSITITSKGSITKNVTFDILENETPIVIRFYTTGGLFGNNDPYYECTAEIL